jgi:hypothetical protein
MKALSVMNPWAYWIIHGSPVFGVKDVENRQYRTNYRGRLLIHASKKIDINIPSKDERKINGGREVDWENLNGRILGSVEIIDCVQDSKSRWAEAGMWHWVLRDPLIFEHPPLVKGALGLWEYESVGYDWYEMMRSVRRPEGIRYD